MDFIEMLGLFAGMCTTTAFLPQVRLIMKTRSVKDISPGMYIVLVTGLACWFCYGVLVQSLSIILANGMTLILASSILVMKFMWDDSRKSKDVDISGNS